MRSYKHALPTFFSYTSSRHKGGAPFHRGGAASPYTKSLFLLRVDPVILPDIEGQLEPEQHLLAVQLSS